MSSNAVGSERISRIVGYKITKGDFSNKTPNLPQRIAIIGEVNAADQGTFPTIGTVVTSAKQAGDLYGYGSPIHMAMRILRPQNSEGVGGIPTVCYGVAEAGGATARIATVTPTGTPDKNGTHYMKIAGRTELDGASYAFSILTTDSTTVIAEKMRDAINNAPNSPYTATATTGVLTVTSKWKGITAEELDVTVFTGDDTLSLTYPVVVTQAGTGVPTVTAELNKFGNDWVTLVVNTFTTAQTAILDEYEAFNGIPDPSAPTGRFAGIVMKPFIALTGSTNSDDTSLTDARKTQVTNAICPAPNSLATPLEAAANMCLLYSRIAQDNPHLDVNGKLYPDMPVNDNGTPNAMDDYENRDSYVKLGNSTVDVINGQYRVQDFVTTYHPDGEMTPQFRYCRNLILDFNIRFGYYLLEQINVVDHVIANDDDVVSVANVVKPKQWTAILNGFADDLANRGLLADPTFMKNSIVVNLSGVNPDRLETFFRYKRTGVVRIASTTAEAGFNFGN